MNTSFLTMLQQIDKSYCSQVPPVKQSHQFIDDLVNLLFPVMENRNLKTEQIHAGFEALESQLINLLLPLQEKLGQDPKEMARQFFESIPAVYEMLVEDAHNFVESDPAANCLEEVVVAYPGFYALTIHRLAHLLVKQQTAFLPRVMSEYAHARTGIDIHPGAQIGRRCYIDHGTGIVIGETAVIGDDVKIYQGVTLGATFVEKRLKHTKRHPTIEDRVILYAGSTILGKNTVIGHDTIIGGNVWLTDSVPPHSVVYRQQQSVVRDSRAETNPINYVI
jgi:serine O-acetyltransferase